MRLEKAPHGWVWGCVRRTAAQKAAALLHAQLKAMLMPRIHPCPASPQLSGNTTSARQAHLELRNSVSSHTGSGTEEQEQLHSWGFPLRGTAKLSVNQGYTSRDFNITLDQCLISVPHFPFAEMRNIKYYFFFPLFPVSFVLFVLNKTVLSTDFAFSRALFKPRDP